MHRVSVNAWPLHAACCVLRAACCVLRAVRRAPCAVRRAACGVVTCTSPAMATTYLLFLHPAAPLPPPPPQSHRRWTSCLCSASHARSRLPPMHAPALTFGGAVCVCVCAGSGAPTRDRAVALYLGGSAALREAPPHTHNLLGGVGFRRCRPAPVCVVSRILSNLCSPKPCHGSGELGRDIE